MKPSFKQFQYSAFLIITLVFVMAEGLNEPCTNQADCSNFGWAHCNTTLGKCECDPGCMEDANRRCVHEKLGSPCTLPGGCLFVSHGVCESNVCVCEKGYIANSFGDACMPRQLNYPCENDTDCKTIGNATCAKTECNSEEGCMVCTCKDGFTGVTGECWPLVKIGEKCDAFTPEVCGLFAFCINHACTCRKGYMKKKDSPYHCKADLYQYCRHTSDCFDQYAVCESVSDTILETACKCPIIHPFIKDHCSAGTTTFSTFSIVGALMALATKMVIN